MSGDVQGDTSKVIPNQEGADINTDGNDKKVIEETEAEKAVDEINQIKTIPHAEYQKLKPVEQQQYVRYNPSLQSMAFGKFVALQNQLINAFNTLGPAIDKMAVLENITFMKDLADQLQSVGEAFASAAKTIESLESVEIIGDLAKPVTSVVKMVGMLCAMIVCIMTNPFNQLKAYIDAFNSIDFSEYKKLFEKTEETPSIEEELAINTNDMLEIHIPSEEIKKKYQEQMQVINDHLKLIKEAYDSIQIVQNLLDSYKHVQEIIDASSITISFGTTAALKKAYEEGYDAAHEKYSKDYTKKAQDLAAKVNGFSAMLPIEWIKISDLEKLKKLSEERKAREEAEENAEEESDETRE